MAQDYRIKGVKRGNEWSSPYGTFQSYALSLDGIGEPVQLNKKVPVNKEPAMGDVLYGELEEKTSQQGRTYYKFTTEQKPEQTEAKGSTYDSNGAKFGNALKIASDYYFAHGVSEMNEDDFVGAIQHLAGRIYGINIPEQAVASTETPKQTTGNTNPEMQSLASTYGDTVAEVPDGEINLDNIPF